MSLAHACEDFYKAVASMAKSTDSLQERLVRAYTHGLSPTQLEDLPEDIRPSFVELKEAMTSARSTGEGTVAATTERMSDQEAKRLINKIVEIYEKLAAEEGYRKGIGLRVG